MRPPAPPQLAPRDRSVKRAFSGHLAATSPGRCLLNKRVRLPPGRRSRARAGPSPPETPSTFACLHPTAGESIGAAAPSAPSRCGKRGQQVRRWLGAPWQTRRPPPRGPGPDAAQVIGTQGAAPADRRGQQVRVRIHRARSVEFASPMLVSRRQAALRIERDGRDASNSAADGRAPRPARPLPGATGCSRSNVAASALTRLRAAPERRFQPRRCFTRETQSQPFSPFAKTGLYVRFQPVAKPPCDFIGTTRLGGKTERLLRHDRVLPPTGLRAFTKPQRTRQKRRSYMKVCCPADGVERQNEAAFFLLDVGKAQEERHPSARTRKVRVVSMLLCRLDDRPPGRTRGGRSIARARLKPYGATPRRGAGARLPGSLPKPW